MNYYKTSITGEISIDFLPENSIINLYNTIHADKDLVDVVNVDVSSRVLMFSGETILRGRLAIGEILLLIAPYSPPDMHVEIHLQGETPSDKSDLVIKDQALYEQKYDMVKTELKLYQTEKETE